jgi:hypothetical protein
MGEARVDPVGPYKIWTNGGLLPQDSWN